jgi:hypothetical protein
VSGTYSSGCRTGTLTVLPLTRSPAAASTGTLRTWEMVLQTFLLLLIAVLALAPFAVGLALARRPASLTAPALDSDVLPRLGLGAGDYFVVEEAVEQGRQVEPRLRPAVIRLVEHRLRHVSELERIARRQHRGGLLLLAAAAAVVSVALIWGPSWLVFYGVLYVGQAAQPLLASRRLAQQRERWETAAASNG